MEGVMWCLTVCLVVVLSLAELTVMGQDASAGINVQFIHIAKNRSLKCALWETDKTYSFAYL